MCDLMVCLVWFHWNFVAYFYKSMVEITLAVGNFKQSVNQVLFLSSTSKGSWCDVPLNESKQKMKYYMLITCMKTILEFPFQNHQTLIFALSTESSFCPAQAREADVMFLLVKVNRNEMMCKYLVWKWHRGFLSKSQDIDLCSLNPPHAPPPLPFLLSTNTPLSFWHKTSSWPLILHFLQLFISLWDVIWFSP